MFPLSSLWVLTALSSAVLSIFFFFFRDVSPRHSETPG